MDQSNVKFFKPILAGAHRKDRIIACIGAGLGIIVTVIVCASIPHEIADLPIIVAPLGASAVLAFAVPSSPLAQPWPVIGGNIISTLIGVAVFQAIPVLTIAAGVAVGAAILAMSMLRCLHPPGGAAALTAVIGSQSIHMAGYAFAFVPMGINSITLVVAAMLFHRMSGHSYPHQLIAPFPLPTTGVQLQDIDAALEDMHESFDIAREDLEALLSLAEHHAAQRQGSA
ncbi:CBS domain-containing membrane protein [Novosphingobium kunmingense]|uniref:CBS domain-containing membrane protein n=1 Tax=Novosphingobium kunmingense TaxID=1211806 RepID=A0A2N0H2Z2_9SPHN|nr:CBS domain-containing membrane protein [Novosphingobium kunmingense]